ncbi:MAG: CDP-alcohol phosphatidyltransferase family protein [Calditrichaeota bacterium]|nr:MAG: CDP-alcohol phosphatidyltransferase family protein [Calditrichota bacterium]
MMKAENKTLSNLLSFIRILFVIPAFYFIKEQHNVYVLYLAALAMLTDFLDGYLARKWHQISELGKILDPLADKVTVAGAVIALYLYQGFPLWLATLIVARDLFIIIGALFIYEKRHRITASNMPGKISVNVIALSILFFLMGWHTLFEYAIYAVIGALLVSLISYTMVFIRYISREKDERKR